METQRLIYDQLHFNKGTIVQIFWQTEQEVESVNRCDTIITSSCSKIMVHIWLVIRCEFDLFIIGIFFWKPVFTLYFQHRFLHSSHDAIAVI